MRAAYLLGVFLLSTNLSMAQQSGSPLDVAHFSVTVIAVPSFSDSKLQDDGVIRGITEAKQGLVELFTKELGRRPEVLDSTRRTSSGALRDWLFADLARNTRTGIHLIFVLTHGFPDRDPAPNSDYSELFLATSDTCSKKTKVCPRSLIASSLRAQDILDAIGDMPNQPTVFLFLDTCGSGAIYSERLRKVLTHDPAFAARVAIFAAAMGNQSAYAARFTKALTKIWEDPNPVRHCGKAEIEKFVSDTLKDIPGTSPELSQTVKFIAPLMPQFCIESFNYNNRLLFLSNASGATINVTVAPDNAEPLEPFSMDAEESLPLGYLKPTGYTIVAKRVEGNKPSYHGRVDLTASQGDVQVLFGSRPIDRLRAEVSAASYLKAHRMLPELAKSLMSDASASLLQTQEESANEHAEWNQKVAFHAQSWKSASESAAQANYALERAQEHRAAVASAAQECGSAGFSSFLTRITGRSLFCSQEYRSVADASGDVHFLTAQAIAAQAAQVQEQSSLTKATLLDTQSEQDVHQASLLRESLWYLQEAQDRSDRWNQLVAGALRAKLPQAVITERGVEVGFPIPKTWLWQSRYSTSLGRVVSDLPDASVEVEVTESGMLPDHGERAAVRQAIEIKQQLVQLGVPETSLVARGFTDSRSAPKVNVIISQARSH